MRIWSLHPKYLDSKRLVAQWREALLARKVLEGKTKGYKNHPQVKRFTNLEHPGEFINEYLKYIYQEALKRGFEFNTEKINWSLKYNFSLKVTKGQLRYELYHLGNKLLSSAEQPFWKPGILPEQHPLFCVVDGGIEDWEKVK